MRVCVLLPHMHMGQPHSLLLYLSLSHFILSLSHFILVGAH